MTTYASVCTILQSGNNNIQYPWDFYISEEKLSEVLYMLTIHYINIRTSENNLSFSPKLLPLPISFLLFPSIFCLAEQWVSSVGWASGTNLFMYFCQPERTIFFMIECIVLKYLPCIYTEKSFVSKKEQPLARLTIIREPHIYNFMLMIRQLELDQYNLTFLLF